MKSYMVWRKLTAMRMLRAAIMILRQARAAGRVSNPQPIIFTAIATDFPETQIHQRLARCHVSKLQTIFHMLPSQFIFITDRITCRLNFHRLSKASWSIPPILALIFCSQPWHQLASNHIDEKILPNSLLALTLPPPLATLSFTYGQSWVLCLSNTTALLPHQPMHFTMVFSHSQFFT